MNSDRELLFGIIALQMGCIERDQLVAAIRAWGSDQAKPLGQILLDQGALDAEAQAVLESMVALHQRSHRDDASRSLDTLARLATAIPLGETIAMARDALVRSDRTHPDPSSTQQHRDSDGNTPPSPETIETLVMPERPIDRAKPALSDSPSPTGRFVVLRPYAQGGLGRIFLARDEELGRPVALKEIRDDKKDHPTLRARFVREAEITGNLEHPGIVPVYGLGHYDDGRPFYAMRFIQGDSLKEAIGQFHNDLSSLDMTSYNLRLRSLLGRFIDVCEAIAYAHARGVLHRDLKPDNVMLGRYGETLIIDWGLAKATGQRDPEAQTDSETPVEAALVPRSGSDADPTRAGRALGTPSYMSPEQASGRLDALGPATDVYALGATLYALLTGRPPVQGTDLIAPLEKARRGAIAPPQSVSPRAPAALGSIALKALALRLEDRYESARALAEDLERYLADEPVSAHRDPLSARLWRWVRKHRTLATTVAATLVVGALSLGVIAGVVTWLNGALAKSNAESESRLDLAMTSIEGYFRGVSEEALRSDQLSEDLRDRLLEQPRVFYEQLTTELAAKADPSERERFLLARGRLLLGRILGILGRAEDSRRELKAACTSFTSLIEEIAADPRYREGLAASLTNLGNALSVQGDLSGSASMHRRAITLRESLTSEFPSKLEYRKGLAISFQSLGVAQGAQGDQVEAASSHRRAIGLWESLTEDVAAEPRYREGLAGSLTNLGNTLYLQGDLPGSASMHRRAIDLREPLTTEYPSVSTYRKGLAESFNSLGLGLEVQGELSGSAASLRRSIALWKGLRTEYASVPEYRDGLAASLINLGIVLRTQGDLSGSAASYREAIDLREALTTEFPSVPEYRNGLAGSLTNLGIVLGIQGDLDDSASSHRRAIEAWKSLSAEFPSSSEYRRGQARGLTNLGLVLGASGDLDGSAASHRRAIAIHQSLVRDHPGRPGYRSALGGAFNNLGMVLAFQDEHDEAVEQFLEAIGHQRALVEAYPRNFLFRQFLSNHYQNLTSSLHALNRCREAAKATREYVALWPGDAGRIYNGACWLALSASIIEGDTSAQERDALAAEAVSTLDSAIATGWDNAVRTANDRFLEPLHDRDDFQALLGRMFDRIFPEPPFAEDRR